MQIFARALVIGLWAEIRNVDDQRIAFPMTAGIAVPLPDIRRRMWTAVHDDIALPALTLTDVIKHRDAAGCLDDAAKASAEGGTEFGQAAGQAAFREGNILRIVVAIIPSGDITRRWCLAQRRGFGIVFSACAGRLLILAGPSRLQHCEPEFPFRGGDLLCFRRQRRDPSIGRIDDQRGACPDRLDGEEHRIIRAGHIALGAAFGMPVAVDHCGALFIQFGALFGREIFLIGKFGRALERRVGGIGPDALQVRFAPNGAQHRLLRRRCRGSGSDRDRYGNLFSIDGVEPELE